MTTPPLNVTCDPDLFVKGQTETPLLGATDISTDDAETYRHKNKKITTII